MRALLSLMLVIAPTIDIVELPPLADVTATAPAERTDPPPAAPPPTEDVPTTPGGSTSSAGGRCTGWEPLLAYYSPGWNVERMSRIMFRESRCQPDAYNSSGASGLLQVLRSHCRWLYASVGPCDLLSADYNVRAAAALWKRQGYQAWAL